MAGWEPNFRMSQVDQGPSVTQILNQGLGGFLNKRVEQLTAEEEKAHQRAREKVADDRAALLFNRAEKAREAELAMQEAAQNKQQTAAQGVGYDTQGNAGKYNEAFNTKIGVQNQLLQGKMSDAIANDAQAKSLLGQYSKEADQGMSYNPATGKMDLPMRPEDLAMEKQIDHERALLASNPSLAAQIGVDKYKNGTDALALAVSQNAPTTMQEYKAQQAQANVVPTTQTTATSGNTIVRGAAPLLGQEVVPGKAAVPGKAGMTTAEFVNSHNLQDQLFGKVPIEPVNKGGRYANLNPFASNDPVALAAFLKEHPNVTDVNPSLLGSVKNAANNAWNAIAGEYNNNRAKTLPQHAADINEYATGGKGAVGARTGEDSKILPGGIVDRKTWGGMDEAQQKATVGSLLGNIKDPAKRNAMTKEFTEALKGTPEVKGTKDTVRNIYGERPILSTGEPVKATVSNTYNGKVVTTRSGSPVDMSGVSETGRGVIVDAHKAFNDQVNTMFGTQDALSELTKEKLGKIATKYGVTNTEAHTDAILKSAGLDGSMTPQQERRVKQLEGMMSAAVEQYKFDYTKDKDKAEMAFKEKQLEIQTALTRESHAITRQGQLLAHKDAVAKSEKDSEYFKAYSRGKGTRDAQWESMTPAERAKDKDARVASKLAAIQNKAGIVGNFLAADSTQYAEALKAVEDEDKEYAATELKILNASRK